MPKRLLFSFVLYAIMLLAQRTELRRAGRGEKAVYALMLAFSLYECIDYIGDLNWMQLYEWNDLFITGTARRIERFLMAS